MEKNLELTLNNIEGYLKILKENYEKYDSSKKIEEEMRNNALKYGNAEITREQYESKDAELVKLKQEASWFEKDILPKYQEIQNVYTTSSQKAKKIAEKQKVINGMDANEIEYYKSYHNVGSELKNEIAKMTDIEKEIFNNELDYIQKNMLLLEQNLKNLVDKTKERKMDNNEEVNSEKEQKEELSIGDAKTLVEIETKLKNKTATDEDKTKFKEFIEQCKNKTGIKTTEELVAKANEMVNYPEKGPNEDDYPDFSKNTVKAGSFLTKKDPSELNDEAKAYVRGILGFDKDHEITKEDLVNAQAKLTQDLSKDNGKKSKVSKFFGGAVNLGKKAMDKLNAKGVAQVVGSVALIAVAGVALVTGVVALVPTIATGGAVYLGDKVIQKLK